MVAAAIDAGGLRAAAEAATRTGAGRNAAAAAASTSDVPAATTWDRTVQRASYAQGAGYQRLVTGPGSRTPYVPTSGPASALRRWRWRHSRR